MRKNGILLGILLPTLAVVVLGQATTTSPIREYVDRFAMPIERNNCTTYHRIHSMIRWTTTTMGRCNMCRKPARMNSAAHNNTFYVSWVGATPNNAAEDSNQERYGHLSTFTFTEQEGFQKVNDFWYEACNYDMGEIAVSADGRIIGALCAAKDGHIIDGAVGEPAFGSNQHTDRRNKLYLFEWTGGEITQTPERIILLQTNIGGANYGHWSISLNHNATKYFLKLKVSTNFGFHESAVSYYIHRMEDYRVDRSISKPTGCGAGHTISNRLIYNTHADFGRSTVASTANERFDG